MGNTRFPNGIALGPHNNFFARSDNVFSQSDATPDVTNSNLFFSVNTTDSVTITDFQLTATNPTSSAAGQFEGKVITVVMLDSNTKLANAGGLNLATSDGLQGLNSTISLVYHNSAWFELHRSRNVTDVRQFALANTLHETGPAIDVTGIKVADILSATGAGSNLTLNKFLNGEQGQELTLFASNSTFTLTVNSASQADTVVHLAATNATTYAVEVSGTYKMVRIGSLWYQQLGGAALG